MKADLHLHTVYSDGELSPERIVDIMEKKGADVIAVTDHDEIEGAQVAMEYAKGKNLHVISGVELSVRENDVSLHLLGYNIGFDSPLLNSLLEKQRERRHERNKAIIENLNKVGIQIDYSEVTAIAEKRTVGRAHIGKALVNKGVCNSVSDAFKIYLSEGGNAYAEVEKPCLKEAIQAIKDAGGCAVVAHPCQIKGDEALREEIMLLSKNLGADGIEAAYFAQTNAQAERFKAFAEKHKLFVTGGSDFHTPKTIELGARFFYPDKYTKEALKL